MFRQLHTDLGLKLSLVLSFFFALPPAFVFLKAPSLTHGLQKSLISIARLFRSVRGGGGAGVCAHVCLDVPGYVSCVTISAPSGGSSLLLKLFVQGEKMESSVKVLPLSQPNAVRGKRLF